MSSSRAYRRWKRQMVLPASERLTHADLHPKKRTKPKRIVFSSSVGGSIYTLRRIPRHTSPDSLRWMAAGGRGNGPASMLVVSAHPGRLLMSCFAWDTSTWVIDDDLQSLEASICSISNRTKEATLDQMRVVVSSIFAIGVLLYTCMFFFARDNVFVIARHCVIDKKEKIVGLSASLLFSSPSGQRRKVLILVAFFQ